MDFDSFDPMGVKPKETQLGPGEDCPDCVHCGLGLHEARPTLVDVLSSCALEDDCLEGSIDVDCPHCQKRNQVRWTIHGDHTWDARALERWTARDMEYWSTAHKRAQSNSSDKTDGANDV